MKWISVNSNDRNLLFRCSACGHIVHYIDGKARGKHKTHSQSKCEYPYCPYCRQSVDRSNDDD